MDVVFLTGAGSEPAQSIARRLVTSGFRVYGFAAQFPEQGFRNKDFFPVPINLADTASVRAEVTAILEKETTVTAVILAGNYPVDEPFEVTHAEDISLAITAGVASPLTIVRAALPALIRRRGHVVAITRTVSGESAVLTAVTDGALQNFTRALFSELRDTGVKSAHIQLAVNAGGADPAARFTQAPQSQIQPDIVAEVVENLLRLRENNALTELVLRPQATREEPRIPVSAEPRLRSIQVVQLPPPQNFPPPDEIISTPERKRPDYAPPPGEGDDGYPDDDDDGVDPELLYLIKPNRQRHLAQEKQPSPDNNRQQKNPRQNKQQHPRDGALKIHPKAPVTGNSSQQNNSGKPQPQPPRDGGKPAPQFSPYPPNWHWPRPPSPQQLERLARRKERTAQQPPPVTSPSPVRETEPIKEFVPPPPREAPPSDIPEFVPPVSTKNASPEVVTEPPRPEVTKAKKVAKRTVTKKSAAKPSPKKATATSEKKSTTRKTPVAKKTQ